MNIILSVDDIKLHHIHFQETVKNTIIEGSEFTRIIYSNELMILNGIYMDFIMETTHVEKYFNKYKYILKITETNQEIISKIIQLEKNILENFHLFNKKCPIYKIGEHMQGGSIKMFNESKLLTNDTYKFMLKISGIWENEKEYGITFKFGDC